jgi:predicted NUDIX family NTP pyrophosphohydrolase
MRPNLPTGAAISFHLPEPGGSADGEIERLDHMARVSSGILLYRLNDASVLEVWIGHMGGPFWSGKDKRGWSIPKGEYEPDEDRLTAARREFLEEIGTAPPPGPYRHLGDFAQPSGKIVTAFATESDFRIDEVRSNTFPLEWPRGSGTVRQYPEIDDARWFSLVDARERVVAGQLPILDALETEMRAQGRSFRAGTEGDA